MSRNNISEDDKKRIVRQFYIDIIRGIECDLDDAAYEEIDQDLLDKYDFDKIVDLCNFDAVAEVISFGVKQKYGIDLDF